MTLKLLYPAIKLVSGHYRKSPTGRTLWCGPFALAVLTGLSYDDAYAKALAVHKRWLRAAAKKRGFKPGYWADNKKAIQGMSEGGLKLAAERLKVKINWTFLYRDQPTMLTFARDHTVKDHVYLLVAGGHYEVICNGILYHSHHDPVPVEDAPKYRMARVTAWADVRVRPEAVAKDDSPTRDPIAFIDKTTRQLRDALTADPVPVQGA